MLSGKTKRGVEIKRTLGMKPAPARSTWMLVVDRTRVLIYEVSPKKLLRIDELSFPEGRQKESELGSDRPGRTFDRRDSTRHGQTGGTRHGYENESSFRDQLIQRIATATAERLKSGKNERRFDRVILLAEPKLVGALKPVLQRAIPTSPLATRESDFSWLEGSALEVRLREVFKETF